MVPTSDDRVTALAALHELVQACVERPLALLGETGRPQLALEERDPLPLGVELPLDVPLTAGELQRAAVGTGARIDPKE